MPDEIPSSLLAPASAHTSHLDKIRYGILQARSAWLTKDDVLNTPPAKEFSKAMKHVW